MKYEIFDAHCDTALKLYFDGKNLYDSDCMVSAKSAKIIKKQHTQWQFSTIKA